MIGWFRRLLLRRRVRRLIRLRHKLRRRYGGGRTFTADQVRTTLEREKVRPADLPLALAIYCTGAEFAAAGVPGDYRELRGEIAAATMGGSPDFAGSEGLKENDASMAAPAGGGGGWFDAGADGGFDGGDAGGSD